MAWHDVMVVVDAGQRCEARVKLAAQLAHRFDWKLNGVAIALPAPPIASAVVGVTAPPFRDFGANDLFIAESASMPITPSDVRLVPFATEDIFRTNTEGIRTSWRELAHGDVEGVINLARRTDLTILGQVNPGDSTSPWGFAPEDVVLGSGGPCLLVPYADDFPTVGENVIVAWDGSREAARALRDAGPLLCGAKKVTVIAVDLQEGTTERSAPNVDEIVLHLEIRGIAVEGLHTLGKPISISDALLNQAADLSADLLVSGSFHHSRLRERFFGGVTQDLLKHMTLPVLMSH